MVLRVPPNTQTPLNAAQPAKDTALFTSMPWLAIVTSFFLFGCEKKAYIITSKPQMPPPTTVAKTSIPKKKNISQKKSLAHKKSPRQKKPAWLLPAQMKAIPGLLPTTYFIADETKVSCRGRYRKRRYRGHERARVRDKRGRTLAVVCKRFYQVLKMEGTGLLRARRGVRRLVNWDASGRFRIVRRCRYGVGVKRRCLLPFHTIAADLRTYREGDVLYIPRLRGLSLPDGSKHSGLFVVQDTGGAFHGRGPRRIDLFVGTQTSRDNIFLRAGVHHRRPEKAFKLKGIARTHALSYLKKRFPQLFSHS
ncbi:MAG: hypothetical protein H6728_01975 [Myxococcales bacterium]|nr:hypothetical protein [Myxococcales bacterium]